MIKTYTLEDPKPEFGYYENVVIDMSHLGGEGLLAGQIVGRSMVHVIDFWLVQFEKDFGPSYPYKVMQVPHTAIVRSMPIDEFVAVLKKGRPEYTEEELDNIMNHRGGY